MPAKRVLIVDDQRDIRQLLRESIRLLGGDIDITDVPSGEEAMLVISRQRFDLLVSDVRLAGMSGLELVRKVRKRNPALKVILVTGMTDMEIRQQVSQADAEAFFFKPVDMSSFQAAVMRCLEQEESGKEKPEPETSEPALARSEPAVLLERLREALDATCVYWIEASGTSLARAGSIPPGLDEKGLIQSALNVEKTNTALSGLLGNEPSSGYFVFRGRSYWLHLAALPEGRFLLALTRPAAGGPDEAAARKIVAETAAALQGEPAELPPVRADEGAPPTVELEEEIILDAASLSEMDSVFRTLEEEKASTQDLDQFWDTAAEQTGSGSQSDSGSISYEQALRLGITPREDNP